MLIKENSKVCTLLRRKTTSDERSKMQKERSAHWEDFSRPSLTQLLSVFGLHTCKNTHKSNGHRDHHPWILSILMVPAPEIQYDFCLTILTSGWSEAGEQFQMFPSAFPVISLNLLAEVLIGGRVAEVGKIG